MNLRLAKGKVPIQGKGETPFLLIDFPDRKLFDNLFAKVHGDNREKYWNILKNRSLGFTLADAGKPYALTRERVRQIEAKFVRLYGQEYWRGIDSNLSILSGFSKTVALMTEMQQTDLPSDDNH
jgi:hypothetical protein